MTFYLKETDLHNTSKTKLWNGSKLQIAAICQSLTLTMVEEQIDRYQRCDDLTKNEIEFLNALVLDFNLLRIK